LYACLRRSRTFQKERVKYVIFGCGSTGYNVAEELEQEDEDLIIVDKDEKRVEDLRDQKYEAFVRDLRDPDLMEGLPVPEVAFILANDRDANLAALKTIKNRYPATYVIARATDPVSVRPPPAGRCRYRPLPAGSGCEDRHPPYQATPLVKARPAAL